MSSTSRRWPAKAFAVLGGLAGVLISMSILFNLLQGLMGAFQCFHIDTRLPAAAEIPGGLFLAFFISLPLSFVTLGMWALLRKNIQIVGRGFAAIFIGLTQGGILVLVVPTWVAVVAVVFVGIYLGGVIIRRHYAAD